MLIATEVSTGRPSPKTIPHTPHLITLEVFVVCNHDARNSVEEHGSCTHRARRQRRVKSRPLVVRRGEPASVLEARHFRCTITQRMCQWHTRLLEIDALLATTSRQGRIKLRTHREG